MKYAVVYVPSATVLAVRRTETTALSRANYIADRIGFDNVRVVEVDDSVKKNQMIGLKAYR